MKGYRQAAVTLHGMHVDDRAWLLGELDQGQRATLEGLIGELDELGFPAQPDLVGRDLGVQAAPAQGPREPVRLVAQLLNAYDWPWTDSFLASLPAPRRAAVCAAMEDVSAAPARDRFVIEQLAARLARQAPQAGARPAQGTSIVDRMRRWIR
jgi:hypothetical protein